MTLIFESLKSLRKAWKSSSGLAKNTDFCQQARKAASLKGPPTQYLTSFYSKQFWCISLNFDPNRELLHALANRQWSRIRIWTTWLSGMVNCRAIACSVDLRNRLLKAMQSRAAAVRLTCVLFGAWRWLDQSHLQCPPDVGLAMSSAGKAAAKEDVRSTSHKHTALHSMIINEEHLETAIGANPWLLCYVLLAQ